MVFKARTNELWFRFRVGSHEKRVALGNFKTSFSLFSLFVLFTQKKMSSGDVSEMSFEKQTTSVFIV